MRAATETGTQDAGGLWGWYQERKRVALSGSRGLFLLGDLGVVALPYDEPLVSSDCCILRPLSTQPAPPGLFRG